MSRIQRGGAASRLTFWAVGRKRRLGRTRPFGPYFVRFQYNGKDVRRCLGTTELKVAVERAQRVIKATYAGGEQALQAALDRDRVTVLPLPKAIELAIRLPLVTSPAVYFLLLRGSVQYVGQSRNVLWRIGGHLKTKSGAFDEIAYIPTPLENLLAEEARYIRLFRPPLNKKCGREFTAVPEPDLLTSVICEENAR